MGFWHYYQNNIARSGIVAFKQRTYVNWIMPFVTAIAWLIVGEIRAENIWIGWLFTLTWAINLEFVLLLCMIKIKGNEDKKDIVAFKFDFRTWFLVVSVVIGTKVFVELIFSALAGLGKDNIIAFFVNIALYSVLVYPWANFYNKQK